MLRRHAGIPGGRAVTAVVAAVLLAAALLAATTARAATEVTLYPRWTLVGWTGTDGLGVSEALRNDGGPSGDLTSRISALWTWDSTEQAWKAYFPSGEGVPGANDFSTLASGTAYFVAITGAEPLTWLLPGS